MLRHLLIGLFLLFSLCATGAGTFTLQGKLRSYSADSFEIDDGHQVYSIQKNRLTPQPLAKVKAAKVGSELDLVVPFSSVGSIRKR